MWIRLIGELKKDENKKILDLFLEHNPVLHMSIIFLTDTDIIDNKFDLVIWMVTFFYFTTIKIF